MAYVNTITDADVKAIIDVPPAKDTTPMIGTASLIVDEQLSILTPAMSQVRLNQICLYLAAQLVWNVLSNGLVSSELEHTRETYKTFSDKAFALMTSRYGQTAAALDTSGTLQAMSSPSLPAKFKVFVQRQRPYGEYYGW